MYLYLVQHAAARSKEEDPFRGLSEKGIADIKKVARFAKGLNIEVHKIFHSGKMRALETAQVMEDNIKTDTGIDETDGLAPMDEPEIWFSRLAEIKENTMLVGHLPHLGKLSMLLMCEKREKDVIDFEMGCIVCLKRSDDGNWTVDWIIKPGMLT